MYVSYNTQKVLYEARVRDLLADAHLRQQDETGRAGAIKHPLTLVVRLLHLIAAALQR